MKQRYIQAFASDCIRPHGDLPSLVLRVDDGRGRFILTVTGPAHGDPSDQHRFPLKMDRDEALGFEDWIFRALMTFPTKGFRTLYTLRSGKIVGIATADGLVFVVLAGHALLHDWDFEWSVRTFVSRYALDDLTDALAALRPRRLGSGRR
jgi:hypothetical protein